MVQRSELFGLRCESNESLLSFYSKWKEIIHKLETNESIAVTDNTFLKVYFDKVVNTPELNAINEEFLKRWDKYLRKKSGVHPLGLPCTGNG